MKGNVFLCVTTSFRASYSGNYLWWIQDLEKGCAREHAENHGNQYSSIAQALIQLPARPLAMHGKLKLKEVSMEPLKPLWIHHWL